MIQQIAEFPVFVLFLIITGKNTTCKDLEIIVI